MESLGLKNNEYEPGGGPFLFALQRTLPRSMPPSVTRGALTFYGSRGAPNPRRVELFMAEHGASSEQRAARGALAMMPPPAARLAPVRYPVPSYAASQRVLLLGPTDALVTLNDARATRDGRGNGLPLCAGKHGGCRAQEGRQARDAQPEATDARDRRRHEDSRERGHLPLH